MKAYVEVRRNKFRSGQPTLVELAELEGHTGFRSVFAWPATTASLVAKQQSTVGLGRCPVVCDTIFVDYDDEPEVAAAAVDRLQTMGHGFTIWDSGNRSVHLHIDVESVTGVWVPAAIKAWVSDVCRPSDLSFYHHAGMFRLPGTVHDATGRAKTLTSTHLGSPVRITPPSPESVRPPAPLDTDYEAVLQRYRMNLLTHVPQGQRSTFVSCMLARDAAKIGLPLEQAMSQIMAWNGTYAQPPHSTSTIRRKVEYEYKNTRRTR